MSFADSSLIADNGNERLETMRERILNPLIILAPGDGDEELCDALEQAQTDASTLWRALEAACRDGWADGPGAMRHYIEEALDA